MDTEHLINLVERNADSGLAEDLAAELIRTAVELLVELLVDQVTHMRVSRRSTEATHLIEVRCHPTDAPKLVGRGGQVVQSLQRLVEALAGKYGLRCRLELLA